MFNKFISRARQKLLYEFCSYAGLTYLAGHLIYSKSLNEHSTVIDLGGNLGHFSNSIFERFNCFCFCVEPVPRLFEKIEFSSEQVKKYNMAICQNDQPVKIHLSNNSEANSLNSTIASVWGETEIIEVPGYNLNTFLKKENIRKVDLLKIDIEGAEIEVFDSLADQFLLSLPQITVEFHEFLDEDYFQDTIRIINRFKSLGFHVLVYSMQKYADVLLLNPKHLNFSLKKKALFHLIEEISYKKGR